MRKRPQVIPGKAEMKYQEECIHGKSSYIDYNSLLRSSCHLLYLRDMVLRDVI